MEHIESVPGAQEIYLTLDLTLVPFVKLEGGALTVTQSLPISSHKLLYLQAK